MGLHALTRLLPVRSVRPADRPPGFNFHEHPVPLPRSLCSLKGPLTPFKLPTHLYWGVDTAFDPMDHDDLVSLVEAVLGEATTVRDLTRYLNGTLLAGIWSSLMLRPRVQEVWEKKFPELAALSRMEEAR